MKRAILILAMVLMLLMLSSCGTTKEGEVPPPPSWVESNPVETKEYIYAVGGPCRSLANANLEAMTKISAAVNTLAASMASSSTTVTSSESNTEGSREKETVFQTEMATKSQAVLNSAHEISRWQDPTTLMWWCLYQAEKSHLY